MFREGETQGNEQRVRLAVSWALVIVWAGFIFFMSAHTGDDLNDGDGFIAAVFQILAAVQEKVFGAGVDIVPSAAHFLEYAVLGALLTNALCYHMPSLQAFLLAVFLASLYGVSDEFHQYFVPSRTPDPLDWVVDTCGAALGGVLLMFGSAKANKLNRR